MKTALFAVFASSLLANLALPHSAPHAANPAATAKTQISQGCPSVLNTTLPRLQDEKPIRVCSVAGRVTLVVNTASKCGYTGQYEELEALHAKYSRRGLSVIGFPTGDFANQEYASNAEIANFCKNTFGIQFPMFAKSTTQPGSAQLNPVYKNLYALGLPSPGWNFNKYLILPDGTIRHYSAGVSPLNSEIEKLIEQHVKPKQ
ncbi:MAG TPA: glutathione peroxidase [Limnobacter sp.]|nr:glutathione peroxidase [Limnobacter sp.]